MNRLFLYRNVYSTLLRRHLVSSRFNSTGCTNKANKEVLTRFLCSATSRLTKTVRLGFQLANNDIVTVNARVGDSFLDCVIDHNIDIDGFGACEGELACSTCHLIFPESIFEKLNPPVCEEEEDMLDLAFDLQPTSRLGCQVIIDSQMEGIIVKVPQAQFDAQVSYPNGMADVRNDPLQEERRQDIYNLLLAAGYFRVRIKTLSAFDVIVGGMVWCLSSQNLSVDLLFEEGLNIGQKITLTEEVVIALKDVGCPQVIEPHQLIGEDFINIYPVMQWLVKNAHQMQHQMRVYNRQAAMLHCLSNSGGFTFGSISCQRDVPTRNFRTFKDDPLSVLLEYSDPDEVEQMMAEQSVEAIESVASRKPHVQQFLSEADVKDFVVATATRLSDEEIMQAALSRLEKEEEKVKSNMTIAKEKKLNAANDINNLLVDIEESKKTAAKAERKSSRIRAYFVSESLVKIEQMVSVIDETEAEIERVREECKREYGDLADHLEQLEAGLGGTIVSEELRVLREEEARSQEMLKETKLRAAKLNRRVFVLQRKLDDRIGQGEMSQYQRRLIELYSLMSSKTNETKQYFNVYNSINDQNRFVLKEIEYLNKMQEALNLFTVEQRPALLQLITNIHKWVIDNRQTAFERAEASKKQIAKLTDNYNELLELQRSYVALVHELGEALKLNEQLSKDA